ncbi:myosin heavy chain, clone 203-like [Channa argus]|uniref:myosin heavy chain, clone 203-like n=1 Tax=Channa argus TaxID=215402 RepID=UPI003522CB41
MTTDFNQSLAATNPSLIPKLRADLEKAKKNEQLLLEENNKLKKSISQFYDAERIWKKKQAEYDQLKQKESDFLSRYEKLKLEFEQTTLQLKAQNDKLQGTKDGYTINEERLVKELGMVKSKLQFEETKRKDCFSQVEQLKKQLKQLRAQLQHEKDIKETEQVRFDKLHEKLQDKQKELTLASEKIHEYKEKISKLKDKAKGLICVIDASNKTITDQLRQLEGKNRQHKHTKEILNDKIKQLQNNLRWEQRKYKIKLQDVEQTAKRQEEQIDEHKKQIIAQQTKLCEVEAEKERLISKIEELSYLITKKEQYMDEINTEKKSLIVDLEKQENEVDKLRKITEHLEIIKNACIFNENKLLVELREENKKAFDKDDEIISLRKMITDSEHKQRLQIVRTRQVEAERNACAARLLKAKKIIVEEKEKNLKLSNQLEFERAKIPALVTKLKKLKRKYNSVVKQLETENSQFEKQKNTLMTSLASTEKDWAHVKNQLVKLQADKENVDKKLKHYEEVVLRLKRTINLQESVKVTQENTLKNYLGELSSLRIEKRELEQNCYITVNWTAQLTGKLGQLKSMDRRTYLRWNRTGPNRSKYNMLLQEKDREIKTLKDTLARRPDDSIKKLSLCQWDNRKIKEQIQSLQGLLGTHIALNDKLQKENHMLMDKLRTGQNSGNLQTLNY